MTKGKLRSARHITPAIFHKVQLHIFSFPKPCGSQAPLCLIQKAHLNLSLPLCLFYLPIALIMLYYVYVKCTCSKSLYEIRTKRDVIKSEEQQNRTEENTQLLDMFPWAAVLFLYFFFPKNYHSIHFLPSKEIRQWKNGKITNFEGTYKNLNSHPICSAGTRQASSSVDWFCKFECEFCPLCCKCEQFMNTFIKALL